MQRRSCLTNEIPLSIIRSLDEGPPDPQAHRSTIPEPTDAAVRHAIETARDEQARALTRLEAAIAALAASKAAEPRDPNVGPRATDTVNGASDHDAGISRVLDAVRQFDRATSLHEILDALAAHAAREISRSALLIVRDRRLRCWSQTGFGPDVDGRIFDPPSSDAGIVVRAIRTRAASVTAESCEADPTDFPFAPAAAGCVAFAAPLIVGGEVVAVFYADEGEAALPPLVTSARAEAWPEILEALVRHASRCLESVTLTRLLGEEPGLRSTGLLNESDAFGSRAGSIALTDMDREDAARRYARLLVSEIRLYHEAEIDAGRRDGTLGVRLGQEIARARELYQARIQPDLARRDDYFQDELVRTLADGDATLLRP